jgi:hypothetical protein
MVNNKIIYGFIPSIEEHLSKLMKIKPIQVDIYNLSDQSAFVSLPCLSHHAIDQFYRKGVCDVG